MHQTSSPPLDCVSRDLDGATLTLSKLPFFRSAPPVIDKSPAPLRDTSGVPAAPTQLSINLQ